MRRHAMLRPGCVFAVFLSWYAGGDAAKLAAAQQQAQQAQPADCSVPAEGQGLPAGVEFLEVLSPLVDSRPKLLARLPSGLEVLAMQDGSAVELESVQVAASLFAGVLAEPLHLPGLSHLVAHCTFKAERLKLQIPTGSPNNHNQQQQQQAGETPQQQGQKQQPEHQKQTFESFAALIASLGGMQHLHLAVTEAATTLAFQVPLEGLEYALAGLGEALASPHLCLNDFDGSLAELKQLQLSLQQKCAADYHCRRNAILKNHVLNPYHRANRSHKVGLELLHALREAQWRAHDFGAWKERQKQQRRRQREGREQQTDAADAAAAAALHAGGEKQQPEQQQQQAGDKREDGLEGPKVYGGFEVPRLVFVEELGVDVLTPDVDIKEAAATWKQHFYVSNAMKLVVVGPASPQDLLLLVLRSLGALQPNPQLRPFECTDTRASDVAALNPQAPRFTAGWHVPAAAAGGSSSSKSRECSSRLHAGGDRILEGPSACPDPRRFHEGGGGPPPGGPPPGGPSSSRDASPQPEPVARLNDLGRLVLMMPTSRQVDILEFCFVFETEGLRKPPCAHPKACVMLAASLLGAGGPGSGVAALQALGLAESVEISVAFSACSMELRVTLAVSGAALRHSVIELAGKIFFAYLQLWRHLPAAEGGWDTVLRRYQLEETAFHLHQRRLPTRAPSLSGLSTAAAYGEAAAAPLTLAPLPHEGVVRQASLPLLSPLEEVVYLSSSMQAGEAAMLFGEEWLLEKVSFDEFLEFLATLNPSRLLLILSSPLVSPLCTRFASFLRLPFSVLPLDESWRSSWNSISSLTAEETFDLAKRLGLALPGPEPFLPMQQGDLLTKLLAAAATPPDTAETAGETAEETRAPELSVSPVSFSEGDICSGMCEAFVDSRNPQRIPKAFATFLLFPLLPSGPQGASQRSSKSSRQPSDQNYARVRTLAALALFIHTVHETLTDILCVAALSGSTVSLGVDIEKAAAKVHIECASSAMERLISLLFLSLRAASNGGLPLVSSVSSLGDNGISAALEQFLDCGAAANALSPLCTGQLDAPTFLSVKQRTLLRVAAAERGSWLECIATEARDQLIRRQRPPSSLVGEILATLTAEDAEEAGLLLKRNVFIQAFFAGDASPRLGAAWANRAAYFLGLSRENSLPQLTPVSAAQPLPLAFLANAHHSNSGNSSSSSSALPVPRIRMRLVADLDKAAACSPKMWTVGGVKANRDRFLKQGGVHRVYMQLGVLTSEQLAAAKVVEVLLDEALRLHFCSRHAACASAEIRLLSEGGFFSSLLIGIRGQDGGSSRQWAAAEILENFLFALGGAPQVGRSALATPFAARLYARASAASQGKLQAAAGAGSSSSSSNSSSSSSKSHAQGQPLPLLASLLSDEALERHRQTLLANLRGADGSHAASPQSPKCPKREEAANCTANACKRRTSRVSRSQAEWLAPSRLVLSEEIWSRRYKFNNINELSKHTQQISPDFIRGFFVSEVLAAPWLLVEVEPYVPPAKPQAREFLVYEQAHAAADSAHAKSRVRPSKLAEKRPKAFGHGARLIEAHPLWRLAGSWVEINPQAAAAVAAAAAADAAAAAAAADAGDGNVFPARWGLAHAEPLAYRGKQL